MARLISSKRTKNVNELQVAIMQYSSNESHASQRHTQAEHRNRVSAYVGEKLPGQDAIGGAQPMDIGQIDKSEGENEDVNAVQQRRPFDRSNQKHKQESDNERDPTTVGLPTRHHQHHASRHHETRIRGVSRRNERKSVSFAAGVVERAILPGSAHKQMIARLFCLDWAVTPLRPSTR